jgi:hypothetical protein
LVLSLGFALPMSIFALEVAPYVAAPVTQAEVAAAHASFPVADSTEIVRRLAKQVAAVWEVQGKVPGRVVLEETFSSEAFADRWARKIAGEGNLAADGHGGMCIVFHPHRGKYSGIALRKSAFVPIDPEKPYAVLYDVRMPEGGFTPLVRLDFFDADKNDLRAPHQVKSEVDATQPTIFHHNATLVPASRPAAARFLQIQFFLSPGMDKPGRATPSGWAKPGMLDNIRVVDLSDPVAARLSECDPVRAERSAAALDDVLVYCDDNVSASYPVLPQSLNVPGRAGATLQMREFPGEKTRATAVLWSKSVWKDVTVSFSDLKGESAELGDIPASCVSAQVLKAHYQGASAPGGLGLSSTKMTLVPELLLNDDSLVVPDCMNSRNLVKYTVGDGFRYVDINTVWNRTWAEDIPADDMPIEDAMTFQPFAMRAGLNKQLVLTFRIPEDAKAGRYAGRADFACGSRRIAALPIKLEVLPLRLPKTAETVYSADREYTMGLYVWGEIDGQNRRLIGNLRRSSEQLLNEYRTLVDYSVLDPTFIWTSKTIFDNAAFRRHLALVREAGFTTSKLHLGASGHLGNATNAVELAALQARLRDAMAVARDFGFHDVYFYGFDEVHGDVLRSQRKAWAAAHEIGAKTMVSGYAEFFSEVGGLLDLIVYADPVGTARPEEWHSVGARIWKYNSPQTFCEDPCVMRRKYGLALWRRGFDGANTYCNFGDSVCWNDVSLHLRRQHCGGRVFGRQIAIVYPTRNGVVPTVALAGLESAIKDVRIFSLLRKLARQKGCSDATAWMEAQDFDRCDLAAVRRRALDWIVKMNEMP